MDTVRQWSLCELLSGMVCPGLPVLPLNESAPSLRSLYGKTLDVQGRKIVQLDCGNGHSLSVQFYVCTGIPFPLVSVAPTVATGLLDSNGQGLSCLD